MSSPKFQKMFNLIVEGLIKNGLAKIFRQKSKNASPKGNHPKPDGSNKNLDRNHPWRLCPAGQHWIIDHPLWVPPTDEREGYHTNRDGHCRVNPGKSEIYTADELKEIAKRNFDKLPEDPKAMPKPNPLGFPEGNRYDRLIAGWTKFWNEILNPKDPLTPDFVKALIASESSLGVVKDQKSKDGLARGPIQVTEGTRKILQNPKGELRNHLIQLTAEESREPITNIAAGIRWLHHKKFLAEDRLKRKITWEEAGAEYKGIFNQIGKDSKTDRIMKDLRDFHQRLKNHRN